MTVETLQKVVQRRMQKRLGALQGAFGRIRTGRAHPSLLDNIMVPYYDNEVPLSQLSSIQVEDARTLVVNPWEKSILSQVEKAIHKSDLGLNPVAGQDVVRVPLPQLTSETRKEYIKQARQEAENCRVALRNARRQANADLKDMLKEKQISRDEERRAEEAIQQLTDRFIASVEELLGEKTADLEKL